MSEMQSAGAYLLVTTTCSDRKVLSLIAERLVEARLAACVQLCGPVQSVYRWDGRVDSAEEWLLQAKTRTNLWEAIVAAIQEQHPYECPELIATPISHIAPDYERWIDETLRG